MEKSKITKSLAVFASVLLIIIIGVASFAYFGTFNVNLVNNVAVNINSSSPGNATFISNATQLNLQVPAANMSFTVANNEDAAKEDTAFLDVTLTGSQNLLTTCTYDIVYEYDSGSNVYGQGTTTKTGDATKEITIEVNGMNGNNHFATETNFDHANIQNYYDSTNKYYKLVEGATIKSLGSTQSVRWKITGRYYNLEASQSQLDGKNFTGKIYAISKGCSSEDGSSVKKGYETILANNGGAASMTTLTSTDFATSTTASDKGMYKAEDDLGMSYYFRGAVDNNWVKYGKYTKDTYITADSNYNNFLLVNSCNGPDLCVKLASKGDDMYWRIIRINGDNSIRMLYTGTSAPDSNTKVVMTESTNNFASAGISIFNQEYNSTERAEYVGYMYEIGKQHGYKDDSAIKLYVDNWYKTTSLIGTDSKYVADTIFCNDRDASLSKSNFSTLTNWNSTGVNYYYRGISKFYGDTFEHFNGDLKPNFLCLNDDGRFTVSNIKGKGNGALTYPVGLITADESYFYPSGGYMFVYTMTPVEFINESRIVKLGPPGALNCEVSYTGAVRPVISLSSKVKLTGDGSSSNPYIISEN